MTRGFVPKQDPPVGPGPHSRQTPPAPMPTSIKKPGQRAPDAPAVKHTPVPEAPFPANSQDNPKV